MRTHVLTPFILALAFSFTATAQPQLKFTDMLFSLSGQKKHLVADVPDRLALQNADTFEQAESIARNQTYEKMIADDSTKIPVELGKILDLAKKKKLTIIVLPGLLSEFNKNRSFEEIFAKPSIEKSKWQQNKASQKIFDEQYDLYSNSFKKEKLSNLLSVGSIDDSKGNVLLKLVLVNNKLGSLESIGSVKENASIFNRRLQKYLDLTQDQNVVLLGFSRGTPLALEMISQAKTQKLSYLNRVQSMVALVGVVMGASIADLTANPTSADGQFFASVKQFADGLQTADTLIDRPAARAQNTFVIGRFLTQLAQQADGNLETAFSSVRSGDFRTMSSLLKQIIGQLNASSILDLNGHVIRLRKFANSVLQAAIDLRTESRMNWFKNNTLPKNIKYYSISAAMVDPENSSIEKEIYSAKIGYDNGVDDIALQKNHRTYAKEAGFPLNDAQVAFHQSTFVPKVIAQLNPENAGIQTEAIGVIQTQHWGASIKVVNIMKNGSENPFPRDNMLVALAAYLNQK